jgi:hypothetical protein
MNWLTTLKDYVPLFQTLVWAVLILSGIILFRRPFAKLLDIIQQRMSGTLGGPSVNIGVGSFLTFSLGEGKDVNQLERVAFNKEPAKIQANIQSQQWVQQREDIYKNNRGLFLVHVLNPSQKAGQQYDIFIYLIEHKEGHNLDQIASVEFFLGRHWGNRVIKVEKKGNLFGVRTSAYGSFLAICHVVFTDGYQVTLSRYIDFEMGKPVITLPSPLDAHA